MPKLIHTHTHTHTHTYNFFFFFFFFKLGGPSSLVILLSLVIALLNKINITTYFENLTVELYFLYALNTHVKFCINWILFTIWSISLYLCILLKYKNLQFKKFINGIVINLKFLASMKNIRIKFHPMVNLSKFTSNKKILSKVIV